MEQIKTIDFERDFKNLYKPLCLFALRYLSELDDAEDIVQQAFADVWEKSRQGEKIENRKAYLFRAVRNRSLTFASQSPHLRIEDDSFDPEDHTEEERIYQAERDVRLWNAIDRLPRERRKIFLLSKRDGLKYQEIAEHLNISVKTVENQMSKALKSLRETAVKIYLFLIS